MARQLRRRGTPVMALLDIAVADKRHGQKQVLRDVQLSLRAGEIVSLVGASGCGKSTLLSIAAGLDPAYRGRVLLDGVRVAGPVDGIGLIFQEPRLFPWLTAAQNVSFGGAADSARVEALLAEVGLDGYAGALPHKLSGGQAQRVAIARGLYTQPRVLLLDEPFSAVDAFTRMQLQDLLVRVAHDHDVTVLVVTHDIDEALHLSDRIVLLETTSNGASLQFDVPLERPRKRGDIASAPIKSAILDRLQAVHAF
jgi:sulfonate transport system ATP-binding protein